MMNIITSPSTTPSKVNMDVDVNADVDVDVDVDVNVNVDVVPSSPQHPTSPQKKIKKRSRKTRGGLLFPYKLQKMLITTAAEGKDDIVSWLEPEGRSFKVHQVKKFVDTVLPVFFKQTKIKSFQRQLNLWGFLRIVEGESKGAYYHKLFIRDRPESVHLLRRQKGPSRPHPRNLFPVTITPPSATVSSEAAADTAKVAPVVPPVVTVSDSEVSALATTWRESYILPRPNEPSSTTGAAVAPMAPARPDHHQYAHRKVSSESTTTNTSPSSVVSSLPESCWSWNSRPTYNDLSSIRRPPSSLFPPTSRPLLRAPSPSAAGSANSLTSTSAVNHNKMILKKQLSTAERESPTAFYTSTQTMMHHHHPHYQYPCLPPPHGRHVSDDFFANTPMRMEHPPDRMPPPPLDPPPASSSATMLQTSIGSFDNQVPDFDGGNPPYDPIDLQDFDDGHVQYDYNIDASCFI